MKTNVVQIYNITPEEFKNEILAGVKHELSLLRDSLGATKKTDYLTRDEAASMLGVSLTTIHFWCKKGILNPMRIGSRIRFNRKDIEETLEASSSNN